MTRAMPSSAVVRTLSDEAMLRALMDASRLTRAQLAKTTGLSKPTSAEAIRRLEAAGLVHDTGERTSGRGGVGTIYALTDEAGIALVVSIAPEGVVAETVDPAGVVRDQVQVPVRRPATPRAVTQLVKRAARNVLDGAPARIAVVSAADPVDRNSGDLVQLPDAPFLVGAMSPVNALQPVVLGRVVVDNDVNWAARAELTERRIERPDLADFAYIYLGEGLGCAVMADGEVRRGHRGIAGEIAHVIVAGPDGSAVALTDVFARLGLRRPHSPAIDVGKLTGVLDGRRGARTADDLARAIWDVITAAIAFHDPELVIIGGTWGTHDRVLDSLRRHAVEQPRAVAIDTARMVDQAPLIGARAAAVEALRADILARIG